MTSKKFIYIFYFFIVACFTLGSINIGSLPITIRHIAAFFMFFSCLKVKPILLKSVGAIPYIFFICIFGLSCLFSGNYEEFFKLLIAYYGLCFITIWSIDILVNRCNTIAPIINSFLVLGLINSYFLILQYLNVPWAFEVMNFFNVEDSYMKYQTPDLSTKGLSYPGIFGAVKGGYYTMVSLICSLYFVYKKDNILSFSMWLFIIVGLFCTQQRTAFFCGVVASGFFFYKMNLINFRSFRSTFLSIVIIVGCIFIYINSAGLFQIFESSRFAAMDELGVREYIYKTSYEYILDNLFFANVYGYNSLYGFWPHNLIFNAFMYGGFFSALIIMYIVMRHMKFAFKSVYHKLSFNSVQCCIMGLAFICYNVESMTHNLSIVTGDILYWLLICPIIFTLKGGPKF